MRLPNVSIIVLSSNNHGINIVLDAILPQLDRNDEIIIVDDHTEEKLLSAIEEYSKFEAIIILHSKHKGNRSYNRNLGAKLAKNEILIFIDGDMVIDETAVMNFKIAHNCHIEVAFIGQTHATRYSDIPLQLFSGINNYSKLISTANGRKSIYRNEIFADKRYAYLTDPKLKDYYWLLYYSGVCSVDHEVFNKTGGFDESFNEWGAEDVDLGYRISKFGKIGFILDIHSVHIPHSRDILSIETSNYNNLVNLFIKYKTWEWELLSTFKVDVTTLKTMLYLKEQMKLLSIDTIENTNENNAAFINVISNIHPHGHIEYNTNNQIYKYECIGISLVLLPKCIDSIYINDNIFIYPNFIYCKILQEAIARSQNVYIVRTNQTIRIIELTKQNHAVDNQFRVKYNSKDIMEYSFEKIDESLIRVTSRIKFSSQFPLKNLRET